MEELQFLAQVIIAGIARGSVIGLVAVGIVVVFTSTRLLNFAAGEFVMVGGIFAWAIASESSPVLFFLGGALVAMLVCALYGVTVERLIIAPLRKRGVEVLAIVIALLGVSIVTAQGVQYFLSPRPRGATSPWGGSPFVVEGVFIGRHTLLTIIGALVTVSAFMLMRQRTSLGLALRAVGSNREGAAVVGLNVRRLDAAAFALAGVVSALAGMLIVPLQGWTPTMGLSVAISAFIAAIVGGISNPLASFSGAMLIGMAGVLIESYISPLFSAPLLLLVLVLVVLIRPHGIIPSRETEEGPLRA